MAMVAAALAALVWANIGDSYARVWQTPLTIAVGDAGVSMTLAEWINSGFLRIVFPMVEELIGSGGHPLAEGLRECAQRLLRQPRLTSPE